MDFTLTEEQKTFQDVLSNFAKEELYPNTQLWDATHFFPKDTLKKLAGLGLGGMYAKDEMLGSNLSRFDGVLIFEQLASGCIPTTAYLTIHNMVVAVIDKYANADIKTRYGQALTSMDKFASYCLTEPDAGSDAASLKTTAKLVKDGYCLNGAKAFISGAPESDVYLVMARTGDDSYKGISCFLVDKSTPGIRFGNLEKKMGWRCQPTAMVFFDDCIIPKTNLIGEEGEGFKIALNALNGGRLNIAACSMGGALTALRLTHSYMQERKQFGKTLANMQALKFYFADMITEFESSRLLLYKAAKAYDAKHENAALFCAMAKKNVTDMAFSLCDKALQIHGGYGYLSEYRIEQIFRDLRVHQILEGTNEIMRDIIAKYTLTEDFDIN